MEHKSSEKKLAREHERYITNREKYREYQRQYHAEHREERNAKGRAYHALRYHGLNQARGERTQQYRLQVLETYSTSPPVCDCCGINEIEFLTLDHPNGGGKQERYTISRRGQEYYRWLINHDFPVELRVLCYNCNFARGQRGYCPHEGVPHFRRT